MRQSGRARMFETIRSNGARRRTADAPYPSLRTARTRFSSPLIRALHALDDHMLIDIGLVRGDVDMVAEELASRSLRKPAKRNAASKAA